MQENTKDPAIKLFGQKIPFPGEPDDSPAIAAAKTDSPPAMDVDEDQEDFDDSETEDKKDKDPRGETVSEKSQKTNEADPPPPPPPPPPNAADSTKKAEGIQNPNTPSIDEESAKSKTDNNSENDQNKTLKKPDKILPCPRCNSMDTKFCYYNNYNVNQPRYFCKACQRYWTAGGTMRNVPVGAGRRKNKNSTASHYRHVTISEALQAARIDAAAPNGTHHHRRHQDHHHHLLKQNGRVLSFGLDPPICDSMASVLNLTPEKKNGITLNQRNKDSNNNNGDDCSSASSITVSNDESEKNTSQESLVVQNNNNNNGFIHHHVPCISTTLPWPYPFPSAAAAPPMCPPGFPMSFYPAAAFWNIPWFPSQQQHHHQSLSSGPNSPTLGKHSRDDNDDNNNDTKIQDHLHEEPPPSRRSVLVPKTLRIDDPSEAAKSSIWATLGIKNECVTGGGMFKGFQSKKAEKDHVVEASPALRANPAALSRSLNFHENS